MSPNTRVDKPPVAPESSKQSRLTLYPSKSAPPALPAPPAEGNGRLAVMARTDPISRSASRTALVAVMLVLATVAAFSPVLSAEFITYDDTDYVTDNPWVQTGLSVEGVKWAFTTNAASNWHPLTWLSLMIDASLSGGPPDPRLFHAHNLLLHAGSVVVLLVALRWMTGSLWRSALAVAIFAIHPLRCESVAWVAERKDVLSVFFGTLALLAYAWYVQKPDIKRYALVALAMTLSLLAKPTLVTLPFLLLLLDYWPLNRLAGDEPALPRLRKLALEKLPLVALSLLSGVATILAQRGGGAIVTLTDRPIPDRLANAAIAVTEYVRKTVLPLDLGVFYPYPHPTPWLWAVIAAGLIITFTVIFWRDRKAQPWMLVGWCWFLVALGPVIGIVQVGAQMMADRYSYIPSIGLGLMVAFSVPRSWLRDNTRRQAASIAAAALVIALALGTYAQASHWQSSYSIYHRTLAVTENNFLIHSNMATALLRQGQDSRASDTSRRAALMECVKHIEAALKGNPGLAEAHNTWGMALMTVNPPQIKQAAEAFGQAVRLKPEMPEFHNNLGAALAYMGDMNGAAEQFRIAAEKKPTYADAHGNLGLALRALGKTEEAKAALKESLRLAPASTKYAKALQDLESGKR